MFDQIYQNVKEGAYKKLEIDRYENVIIGFSDGKPPKIKFEINKKVMVRN